MARHFTSLSIWAVAVCSVPADANNFLRKLPAFKAHGVLTDEISQSLFLELAGSLGHQKVDKIKRATRQTFTSLTKDAQGNLDHAGVRYALHRYFVQRHGWYVKGLRPSDGAWSSSSPHAILKDRVPGYILNLFEQRLGRHGFGLHELAVFAATLEDLISQEASGQLEVAYRALRLNTTSRHPANYLDIVLDAYMMAYITGGNLSAITPGRFKAQEKLAEEIYPAWPQTKQWLRDLRQSIDHVERYSRNMFASGLSFADAGRVVDEIGYQFGPFQALECHTIKSALIEKEHQGTGRVRLSRFYERTLGGQWEFSESVDYLRQLGALDETDPQRVSVVIPNYINSMSNCIAPSNFYSVCCRDECESLQAHLEEKVAAPQAAPERIAELVGNLPSDTVEAPRNLSATLLHRLQDIADHHGGTVPLHGRLFSQWMHNAYPRECGFPYAADTMMPLNLIEAIESGRNPAASEEEMRLHQEKLSSDADDVKLPRPVELEEALPWNAVEELVVSRRAPPRQGGDVFKNGFFVLGAVLFLGALVRFSESDTAHAKVERHFV